MIYNDEDTTKFIRLIQAIGIFLIGVALLILALKANDFLEPVESIAKSAHRSAEAAHVSSVKGRGNK